jgi:hypothetical protein
VIVTTLPATLVVGTPSRGSTQTVVAVNGPSALGDTRMFWVAGAVADTLSRTEPGEAVRGPPTPVGVVLGLGVGVAPLGVGDGVGLGPSALITMAIDSVAVLPPPPRTVTVQKRLTAAI